MRILTIFVSLLMAAGTSNAKSSGPAGQPMNCRWLGAVDGYDCPGWEDRGSDNHGSRVMCTTSSSPQWCWYKPTPSLLRFYADYPQRMREAKRRFLTQTLPSWERERQRRKKRNFVCHQWPINRACHSAPYNGELWSN